MSGSRWHEHQVLARTVHALPLLTAADLVCASPVGDHHIGPLLLSARCHPTAAVFVEYADGELQLTCAATIAPAVACRRPVARIAVAAGAPR